MCAADVGGEVWPDRVLRAGRGVATGGGGDYAAQMLLGKLRAAKQVEHARNLEGATIWCITVDGVVSLAAAERAAKEERVQASTVQRLAKAAR
jgi:hypothetical protein